MGVAPEIFEQRVELVRSQAHSALGGLYGPRSIAWEINRELALFAGGGAAALLQLAHPFVAYAVDQHSQTRADPAKRFQRTFFHVYRICFGDLEHAVTSARRVYEVHRRIEGTIDEDVGSFSRGTRYEATDPDALLWVHATLNYVALQVFELLVRPLSPGERDEYIRSTRLFALLFGADPAQIPTNHAEFQSYCDQMFRSPRLTVSHPGRSMAHFLLNPAGRRMGVLYYHVRLVTAALLPHRLRHEFGLVLGDADWRAFRLYIRRVRRLLSSMPLTLRHVPAYHEAMQRMEGRPTTARLGRVLHRAAMSRLVGGRASL